MSRCGTGDMRVLHLTFEKGAAVRLQRYLQSNLDDGITPVVLCRAGGLNVASNLGPYSLWFTDQEKVSFNYFSLSNFNYSLDRLGGSIYKTDKIGLKNLFSKLNCQIVHAHSPESAYYSYKLGLPTLFDDWECWLDHYEYCKPANPESTGLKFKPPSGLNAYNLSFLRNALQRRFKKIVLELIKHVPIIATNEEAAERYRNIGASDIWSVPNVPLTYERDYGLEVKRCKNKRVTTCYIGNLTADSKMFLRNTSGVRELWQTNDLGDLHVFEGENYLPHLELFRAVRNCHFNLLFWKPLAVHRYYLQNKAFLASVVGVPTIISSSLKATIDLLGDYALPVESLNEIPGVIKNYDYFKDLLLNPAHLWEYYVPQIRAAYDYTLKKFG